MARDDLIPRAYPRRKEAVLPDTNELVVDWWKVQRNYDVNTLKHTVGVGEENGKILMLPNSTLGASGDDASLIQSRSRWNIKRHQILPSNRTDMQHHLLLAWSAVVKVEPTHGHRGAVNEEYRNDSDRGITAHFLPVQGTPQGAAG